jgi:hypothetical protein
MTDESAYERLADLVEIHDAAPDEAELRAAVEGSPRLRARLERLRRVHRLLRGGDEAPRPGAALEARVLSIPGLVETPRPAASGARGWAAVGAIAAAACIAALLVITSVGGSGEGFEPLGAPVRLTTPADAGMSATVELGKPREGRQSVRVVANGLHDDGTPYALWLIAPGAGGAGGAVKVGEFAPDAEGECIVMLDAAYDAWRAAVITHADQTPGSETLARATLGRA